MFPAVETRSWIDGTYGCRDAYIQVGNGELLYKGTTCKNLTVWVNDSWGRFGEGGGSSGSGMIDTTDFGSGGSPGSGSGGGYTPPKSTPKDGDPCASAKFLSLDAAFKSRVSGLYNEVKNFQSGVTTENGWLKASDSRIIQPSSRKATSITFDMSSLSGSTIKEWYHSHPGGGSVVPSWQDLVALSTRYRQGKINPEDFTYGVVSEFGCTSLVISSESNFKAFVGKVLVEDENIQGFYREAMKDMHSPEERIAKYIQFLDKSGSGITYTYAPIDYDTGTLGDWNSKEVLDNILSNKDCD